MLKFQSNAHDFCRKSWYMVLSYFSFISILLLGWHKFMYCTSMFWRFCFTWSSTFWILSVVICIICTTHTLHYLLTWLQGHMIRRTAWQISSCFQTLSIKVPYWKERLSGSYSAVWGFPAFAQYIRQFRCGVYGLPRSEYHGLVKVVKHTANHLMIRQA